MKKILLTIIFLILVVLNIFLIKFNKDKKNEISINNNIPISKCGLTVISPLPDDIIILDKDSNSFKVKAIIDNTKRNELGCSWTVFEAQAGLIEIYDEYGKFIGQGLLKVKNGLDWMTDNPTEYESIVKMTSLSKRFTLILKEENPSGEGDIDTVKIPLKSNYF